MIEATMNKVALLISNIIKTSKTVSISVVDSSISQFNNLSHLLRIKFLVSLVFVLFIIYAISQYAEDDWNRSDSLVLTSDSDHSWNQTQRVLFVLESECHCRQNEQIFITSQQTKQNDNIIRVHRYWKDSKRIETNLEMPETQFAKLRVLCDWFSVLRRGLNQHVVGYSLYGKKLFYYDKLINISSQIDQRMPGWSMRVHHDNSINRSIVCQIECLKRDDNEYIDNADFCDVNQIHLTWQDLKEKKVFNAGFTHSMSWRWFPVGCSFVDVFSSRDTDSFILQRELDSVSDWLSSDKSGHIMRDHPYHDTTILGGMLGYRNVKNRKTANIIFEQIVDKKIATYYNENGTSPKEADQVFLNDHVYSLIVDDSVIHDSYLCDIYADSLPWPSKRLGDCYVGSPSGCNETAARFKECPIQCRPKDHPDWLDC